MTTPHLQLHLHRRSILLLALALFCSTPSFAQEQRPPEEGRERGGPRGGRGGEMMRMNPVITALDTNGDGVIDEKEIANAPAALKKLDKNGDGKLTQDEIRPAGGRRGEEGQRPNPEEMVNRLMQFDKNGDGKLTKDEVPERMQGIFERGDKDKDGVLTRDELKAMAASSPGQGGGPGRPPGEGGDRPPAK